MRRARIPYSPDEMTWLEDHRSMIISDYHRDFVEKFKRSDVTLAHLHGLRKRKGWKVGRAPGRFNGRRLRYSEAEIAWLRKNATMEISAYTQAFRAAFDRDDVTPSKLHGLRKREGWKTGRTGQFAKGIVPANKGKKMPFNAASAATRFKAGQLPHTYRGPGHETTDAHGYVWIIVETLNPYTGAATLRVLKHKWLWEQQNGAVPAGYALKCIDGNKANTDPSNWELIPRAMLPRLNGRYGRGYDEAPAELKPTILAVAKLEHRLKENQRSPGAKAKRT